MKAGLLALTILAGFAPLNAVAMKGFGQVKPPPAPAGPKPIPRPVVVMPEGFVGKEQAVLAALFPEGFSDTANAPNGARLREARRWNADKSTLLAVLVDRWAGALCEFETCEAQPTDLALLREKAGKLEVVGSKAAVGHHGGHSNVLFDQQMRRLDREITMLGVVEETITDDKRLATLRLFHFAGGQLSGVFERRTAATIIAARDKKVAGCVAPVRSDEFGTPPWALQVKEHCTTTGKESTERWRWDGTAYRLHGPPSDAETPDDFKSEIDEPTR